MADNFIHLHLHSQFSNYGMKDAISSVDGIIGRVHELGQRGFALTDHNGCSGLIDTYVHLQKYNKKHGTDLKLVMGSELYYTYDVHIKDKSYSHILFLAKNQTGLENLFKLTTEAHKHYYYKSRVDLDMIRKYSDGLICTSACMGGWLKGDNRESLIPQFKDIFGDDLYFEIHTYQHEDQKRFNAMVAEMGAKYNVPLIAACDSHYVHEEDYGLHQAFRGRSKDDDEDQYYASNDFFIQSEAQVFDRLYPQFGVEMVETMIENTNVIFDKCNAQVDFNLDVYPKYVKDGDVKPVFLQALRDGYKQKIIGKVTPEFKKRVDERVPHEIDILEQVGYMDYLLITKDILDACRERDIPVGHGRGSVGGCECAYLLDITSLDAITNNLYFERFANPNRVSPPDVDNDCSKVRRGEVIQYLEEKYKYVYQCRTFSYMKASGALKEAARCLGVDHTIADAYSKKIKDVSFDDDEDYHDNDLEYAKLDHVNDGKYPEMFALAKQLVGIMTGFGKHASAVIVSNQDITKYCSLEMQKDSKTKEETFVASTNFKHLESMGFLKEDILGLRTLDVINDCVTMAGVKDTLDMAKLPWDDKKTLELLCKGDTLGVFQMKSFGMVKTLKSIAPKNFIDLIAVVALYRPACILTGMLDEYIERRQGKPFEYLDERLEEPLGETYGIMVFQEQIMRVCQVIAGYSMAEADTVRRAVGKKDHDLMQEITAEFVDRAVTNGTNSNVAQQILDQIIAAASYGFNKAHSQSYGYMAYITAYLKAHYPLEFYVATINSEDGNQEKILPYIQEIKRKGIEVLPPDLRHSQREWTVQGNAIRVGLAYIKGINKIEKPHEYTIDAIFSKYTKLQLEGLVGSGALDFLGETNELMALIPQYKSFDNDRKNSLAKIDEWKAKLKDHRKYMDESCDTLSKKEQQSADKKLANIEKKIQEWTDKYNSIMLIERPNLSSKVPVVKLRYKYLGCTFEDPLKGYNTNLANGRDVKAIIVSDFKQKTTKAGKPMAYVFDHVGNKYVMWSNYLVELQVGTGYYIQVRGDTITKVKPLELKQNNA
jgi:DNA polymerase-3 subunit alpha|nr:MAG TPA: DNA polymerase III, alpha subunit [Caudoviricetes sp.]